MFGQSAPQALRNTRMAISVMLRELLCACVELHCDSVFESRKRPQAQQRGAPEPRALRHLPAHCAQHIAQALLDARRQQPDQMHGGEKICHVLTWVRQLTMYLICIDNYQTRFQASTA